MPATVTPLRCSASVVLDDGQKDGKQITKTMSIGTLSYNAENDKIIAVVQLLGPCLAKTVITTRKTSVVELK